MAENKALKSQLHILESLGNASSAPSSSAKVIVPSRSPPPVSAKGKGIIATVPTPPPSPAPETSAQPLQPSAELESISSDPAAESLLLVPLQSQPPATPALHADALTGTIPSLSFPFSPSPLLILMFRLYFHNGVYLHPHIL
jgi:hypothetical protein